MEHTKGKIQISKSRDVTGYPLFSICGLSGTDQKSDEQQEANARRIELTYNTHAALVQACQRVRSWLNEEYKENLTKAQCEQILHEALAQAKEVE